MIRAILENWRLTMKRFIAIFIALLISATVMAGSMTFAERVAVGMQGNHRSEDNKARNQYRHPVETLKFFGIKDGMTVMEIWPGGGWYTEILAPAMRGHGKLIIATWDPKIEGQPAYRYELPKQMEQNFASNPQVYDQVALEYFSPPGSSSLGEAESVDAIVTFRNTHGWIGSGDAQDIFNEFARVLKPGGILGLVQHRAKKGTDPAVTAQKGYVSEQAVKELAANAGFVFEDSSEANANPKDSRDHPEGVWTLPPGLSMGDEDKEKYMAIGESDRMTLRFRKGS